MDDVDVLESILAKDVRLLENVRPDQLADPTPCPDYDVRALADHVAGWAGYFAAAAAERPYEGDPSAFRSDDPAGAFRAAAEEMASGWRRHGTDRAMPFGSGTLPGSAILAMTLMEYVTHGCDLAIATGQEVPFTDDEVETTLARARTMLADESRRGQAFGPPVAVPDDAPAVDRLLGWMGRRPLTQQA